MKAINWLYLTLSLSFVLFYGNVKANAILSTPEPVAIRAVFNDMDTDAIMESLTIDGYSHKVVDFIERHLPMAIIEMQQTGIPASITLSQLILETGYGSSQLFKEANNGFGIKYKQMGASFFYKGGHYKQYDNIDKSFKDHSMHLLEKYHARKLLNKKVRSYRVWTKMLVDIDYAEDLAYRDKLNNIIERYSFYNIDKSVWAAADVVKSGD